MTELRGERVVLRPVTADDVPQLVRCLGADPGDFAGLKMADPANLSSTLNAVQLATD